MKTYSRARAAVAAAKKALVSLAPFIVNIEGVPHEDKFAALVHIRSGGGAEIVDAVTAAGFFAKLTGDPVAAEIETKDETVTPPEPVQAPAVKKKRGGYINENSSIKGACHMVRAIAADMHDANPLVKKSEVINACRAEGIAYGTARTQYQKWLSARK